MLRDWGQGSKYHHIMPGYNYRMDAIQGAVLKVKMEHIEGWTAARRGVHSAIRPFIGESLLTASWPPGHSRHVYHVYAIQVASRDRLKMASIERVSGQASIIPFRFTFRNVMPILGTGGVTCRLPRRGRWVPIAANLCRARARAGGGVVRELERACLIEAA